MEWDGRRDGGSEEMGEGSSEGGGVTLDGVCKGRETGWEQSWDEDVTSNEMG